ncbi:MAG: hypothetical protein OEZ39_04130 [Gammaproteobacteria bacterium]|nr:hypothetical protein [Gammaproteobacteria bacterium]MDH5651046.1 hypothetical protein [Gammaproteobacteria bacterium]
MLCISIDDERQIVSAAEMHQSDWCVGGVKPVCISNSVAAAD